MSLPEHLQKEWEKIKNQPQEPKPRTGWQHDWDDWRKELTEQIKEEKRKPPIKK